MSAPPTSLWPAEVVVDLDAIAANVRTLRERVGGAELMAVVKADAYGHGLVPSARAALAGGACSLGVAQATEALALRAAGVTAPVLAWLVLPGPDLGLLLAADVEIAVAGPELLEAVAACARGRGRPAVVQLKVDTGLARNGAYGLPVRRGDPRTDWSDLVARRPRWRPRGCCACGVSSPTSPMPTRPGTRPCRRSRTSSPTPWRWPSGPVWTSRCGT